MLTIYICIPSNTESAHLEFRKCKLLKLSYDFKVSNAFITKRLKQSIVNKFNVTENVKQIRTVRI